jgi:hypothetical protein
MAEFVKKIAKNAKKCCSIEEKMLKINSVQPEPSSFYGENVGKILFAWNPGKYIIN